MRTRLGLGRDTALAGEAGTNAGAAGAGGGAGVDEFATAEAAGGAAGVVLTTPFDVLPKRLGLIRGGGGKSWGIPAAALLTLLVPLVAGVLARLEPSVGVFREERPILRKKSSDL